MQEREKKDKKLFFFLQKLKFFSIFDGEIGQNIGSEGEKERKKEKTGARVKEERVMD